MSCRGFTSVSGVENMELCFIDLPIIETAIQKEIKESLYSNQKQKSGDLKDEIMNRGEK